MKAYKKIAFIFPGQGAQYVGMGKDFLSFATFKRTLEEAEDCLKRKISSLILEGPETTLTETHNSQTAIFVISIAILRVLQEQLPELRPAYCAGLSLGEYSALHASQRLAFAETLSIVQRRGLYMSQACEKTKGSMAVILGLDGSEVEELVEQLHLPHDLWVANFNCPGQVVISGSLKGIEVGTAAAKARGAKRVLPLQVHGAFHSGLMQSAETSLAPYIFALPIVPSSIQLIMNTVGAAVDDSQAIKENLIRQVTHSVRWEQGIRYTAEAGVDLFLEIGCGKTLAGFNKRIPLSATTLSLEKVEDLKPLQEKIR